MEEIIIKLAIDDTDKADIKLLKFDANSDVITKDSIGKIVLPFNKEKPTYKFVNKCGCNISLNLIDLDESIDIEPFYTKEGVIPEFYIQFEENGSYYKVIDAMPNTTTNSPDVIDPPPPGPRNGSSNDKWESFVKDDPKIAVNLKWLDRPNEGIVSANSIKPVVAIMDTGIDLRYFANKDKSNFPFHFYENNSCGIDISLPEGQGKLFGWSFLQGELNPENPFDNDLRHKHGTRIAKIIANVTKNKVRIMPLKTANYKGESYFFDIFCAFEYIISYNRSCNANDRVKFINASWGYYGREYDMFKEYIGRLGHENGNRIEFINAAGNAGDIGSDNIEIGDGTKNHNRYPTMYAPQFDHVYTVTTLDWTDENVAVENYSPNFVEIGVRGQVTHIPKSRQTIKPDLLTTIAKTFGIGSETEPNEGDTIFGTFPDPLNPNSVTKRVYDYIKGSSYATAYVTGYMIKNRNFDYDRRGIVIDNVVNKIVIKITDHDPNNTTLEVIELT